MLGNKPEAEKSQKDLENREIKNKTNKYLLGLLVPSLAGGAGKAWAVTMASED